MIINSKLLPKPIVLNTSDITSSGGTLTQSIANFKRIKVYYSGDDGVRNYVEYYNNGVSLITATLNILSVGGGMGYLRTGQLSISNKTVTLSRLNMILLKNNASPTITENTSVLVIKRIEGYTD